MIASHKEVKKKKLGKESGTDFGKVGNERSVTYGKKGATHFPCPFRTSGQRKASRPRPHNAASLAKKSWYAYDANQRMTQRSDPDHHKKHEKGRQSQKSSFPPKKKKNSKKKC